MIEENSESLPNLFCEKNKEAVIDLTEETLSFDAPSLISEISWPCIIGKTVVYIESTASGKCDYLSFGKKITCEAQKPNVSHLVKTKKSKNSSLKKSIIRTLVIHNNNVLTFGRFSKDISDMLWPLIITNEIKVSGTCMEDVSELRPFMRIKIEIEITLQSDKLLNLLSDKNIKHIKNIESGIIRKSMYDMFLRLYPSIKHEINVDTVKADPDFEKDFQNFSTLKTPNGLNVELKAHQVKSLAWMLQRESNATFVNSAENPLWVNLPIVQVSNNEEKHLYVNKFTEEIAIKLPNYNLCQGGILADEMGLGKTISVLSLLLKTFDKNKRPTLIVCPTSLVGQWNQEIRDKIDLEGFKACIYYGSDRDKLVQDFHSFTVVLTTYGTISEEFQKSSFFNTSAKHKSNKFELNLNSNVKSFAGYEWERIVLDEGHLIKNVSTHTFKACLHLQTLKGTGKRWVLTGTPIQNSLNDIFALVKFIRIEPWCHDIYWQRLISKKLDNGDFKNALNMVKFILDSGPIMLRRTKKTTAGFEHKLPKKSVEYVEVEFSPSETEKYLSLLSQSVHKVDTLLKEGSATKKYAEIFALLLRLRQACNHSLLSSLKKDSTIDQKKKRALRDIKRKCDNATFLTASLNKYLSKRRRVFAGEQDISVSKKDIECPVCFDDELTSPVMTCCGHIMCESCILDALKYYSKSKCPVCRKIVEAKNLIPIHDCLTLGIETREDVLTQMKSQDDKPSAKVEILLIELRLLKTLNDQSVTDRSILKSYIANDFDNVVESPIKVLVFSQWTSFFDILQIKLDNENFKYVRFDGSMSTKQRERALSKFSESKEDNILLISLKAGALGLNLTMANVIYILDPWFNPAVEEQAINRCHRMGQTRPVVVKRFVIKNSVEIQIRNMQKQKLGVANEVLSDSREISQNFCYNKSGISFEELLSFFKQPIENTNG